MQTDKTRSNALLETTFAGFAPLAAQLAALDTRLAEAAGSPVPAIADKARQLRRKLAAFEPGVTMIGQVKAGKTTLVNAMTGWRDLLPADVNPWTSVVTSLHLRPGDRRATQNASFTFFTEEEWGHLVHRGGRMGELANRAGAEDELDKVRAQLEEMRRKSRERLGRRFELLLGQSHDYDRFDAALVERYVCLGDDFWDAQNADPDRGRFADITRTADLWLSQPDLPLRLCLRDTPGVNDTFMIREQITLNALRGSRLCVMVLAATQALTSVDLALIRMISNVEARDVIIFVNRIDELADPARDVPEIRASIETTLRAHGMPEGVEILFGCGVWAHEAVTGAIENLGRDSAEALLHWAEARNDPANPFASVPEMVWHLSGLHALGRAIAARIEAGAGAQILREITAELDNLDQSAAAALSLSAQDGLAGAPCRMERETLVAALDGIEARAREGLATGLTMAQRALVERIEKSRQTFVGRATAAVIAHLENYGELEQWSYDPCGLRVLLRSSFQRHVRGVTRLGEDALSGAAQEIAALYAEAFALSLPPLQAPPVPQADPPIVLGQTIALDLRASWWTRFWRRRRGYKACTEDFARLIEQETQPILNALLSENAARFEADVADTLATFLAANRRILLDLADGVPPAAETLLPTRPNLEATA
ncbi:dynamin family protein [Pseudoponticoccus marisrubri]|uniref:Dynamin N-terminal domain-containing protein n=1 Tax=Pseudoponticoccus marisrubri TaxID=1685382 RepID=A0A0W7WKP8_9RHOB|nr:dynamin family protein [Pseudoponticoccus marisrubri]KUF11092.1 hypothetical protein AVJ23_08520 [Pseudoponticoccus marisrubri]